MPIERLSATRSFLREIIEAVPGAVYAKDCAGRILLGNRAFAEAVGWQSGSFIGKNDLELLADKDLARVVMENDRRILDGQGRCQVEETLRAEDGSTTYWLSTKAPFTDDEGNVAGLLGVSIEITERKRIEERERLLAREIEHRNKNLLNVVQSVVRLTGGATVQEFREGVSGRLDALCRAQRVLAGEQRKSVELRSLPYEELEAYCIDTVGRVQLVGPEVSVSGNAAQPLALLFHELATNAAKYGAFAMVSGMLEVIWGLCPQSGTELTIEWRESGGPSVRMPAQQGFGSKLVHSVVELQLHGTLSTVWEPGGVRYSMSLPLKRISPN